MCDCHVDLPVAGFWLPVGTSEKVSLGLTVLLAFYVLTLSIADRIPETSEFVPLVGKSLRLKSFGLSNHHILQLNHPISPTSAYYSLKTVSATIATITYS